MADDLSMSTVTADPSLDTFDEYSSDGGASEVSHLVPIIGQWGSTIASIVTGHPIQAQQTAGGTRIIGAKGSSLSSAPINSTVLLLVLAALVALVIVFAMAGRRTA